MILEPEPIATARYLPLPANRFNEKNMLSCCFGLFAMLNPDIASKVFRLFSQITHNECSIKVNESAVSSLLDSEWQIIQQIANGLSNKEIATKLFLSEGTVRNYLSTVLSKLQLRDRTQLAIWAVQTGVTTRQVKHD